jgi:hypothetical protein
MLPQALLTGMTPGVGFTRPTNLPSQVNWQSAPTGLVVTAMVCEVPPVMVAHPANRLHEQTTVRSTSEVRDDIGISLGFPR